jgi:hypothetical protein
MRSVSTAGTYSVTVTAANGCTASAQVIVTGNISDGLITYYVDADGDGYGSTTTASLCSTTPPAGYATSNTDCNDNNASIKPGAAEVCDGIDNNCNGQIDEGVKTTFYKDADNDGYSDGTTQEACAKPEGYKAVSELTATTVDCNDAVETINPGAAEVCDGIDNNCNGVIDEGFPDITYYRDADGDGYGNPSLTTTTKYAAPAGYVANSGDCNDAAGGVNPGATEVCDGVDNDCDGFIDEGVRLTFYRDADGDGFGNPLLIILACAAPVGYVTSNTDCMDNDPTISPAAVELCGNRIDDNCNGVVDEVSCAPCLNATRLTTSGVTATSVQFNWTANANPAEWQVQYKTTNKGSNWLDVLLTGNKRSVIIQGLLSNQNYQWQIRARCGKTWTAYSISTGFKTLAIIGTATYPNVITSTKKPIKEEEDLEVKVLPNPSSSYFTLVIRSSSDKTADLRIVDAVGRIVESKSGLAPNSTHRVGHSYRPGVYIAQMMQGNKMVTVKLIKQIR